MIQQRNDASLTRLFTTIIALCAAASWCGAQCLTQTFIDADTVDSGTSHADMDDERAVVTDTENRVAIVYEKQNGQWQERDRLTPIEEPGIFWGIGVAIDGDFIAVLTPQDTIEMFRYDTAEDRWVNDDVIVAGGFGFSNSPRIDFEGGRLVASAVRVLKDQMLGVELNVYMRGETGWEVMWTNDAGGAGVAIHGDRVATVIDGETAILQLEPDGTMTVVDSVASASNDLILLEDRLFVVGHTQMDEDVAVYIRSGATWTLESNLQSPGTFPQPRRVAANNHALLMGLSPFLSEVFSFRRDFLQPGWRLTPQHPDGRIVPPVRSDRFGTAVAMNDTDALIVSLDTRFIGSTGRRRVDFYTGLGPDNCNENTLPDACEILAVPALDKNDDGAIDFCDDNAVTFYIGPDGGQWYDLDNWTNNIPRDNTTAVVTSHVVISGAPPSSGFEGTDVRIESGGRVEVDFADFAASKIDIRSGGTLSGEGIVRSVIDNHGALAPGTGVGTLQIDGVYNQFDTGRLEIDITGASPLLGFGHDVLEVNGLVDLAGELRIVRSDGLPPEIGVPQTVLTFDAKRGSFDHVTALAPASNTVDLYPVTTLVPGAIRVTLVAPDPLAECIALDQPDDSPGAVALQGDTLIHGLNVWQRASDNSWSIVEVLELPDGTALGGAPTVALDGDLIAIGDSVADPNGLDNAGVVYLFRRSGKTTWMFETTLEHPQPESLHGFGTAVAIQGETVFVGAPVRQVGSVFDRPTRRGSVVVFENNGTSWDAVQTLARTIPGNDEHFGWNIAVSGDRLLIGGLPLDNFAFVPFNEAVAWLYQRTDMAAPWEFQCAISAPDARDLIRLFGLTVALDGDTAAIGSINRAGPGGPFDSVAHIFELRDTSVIEVARFVERSTGFVYVQNRLVIDGETIAHGIIDGSNGPALPTGRVHLYRRNADDVWIRDPEPVTPDPDDADQLGQFLALDNGTLAIVGGPDDADLTILNGVVAGDCNDNGIADQCDILSGEATDADDDGRPDDCPVTCRGDCSPPGGNGVINIDDLLEVVQAISTQDPACDLAPDNGDGTFGDGVINIDDLFVIINALGPCP